MRRFLNETIPERHVWVDIIMLVANNGDWRMNKTLLEEEKVEDDVKGELVEQILKAPRNTDKAKEKLLEEFYGGPKGDQDKAKKKLLQEEFYGDQEGDQEGGPEFGRISEDEGQIPETVRGKNFFEAAKGAREANMIRRSNDAYEILGSNDAYEILGVEKGMEFDETKKAAKKRFKKLSAAYHPDKGGSEEVFQKINQAYNILTNEEKYWTYDPERNIFTYAKTSCGKCGGANKKVIRNAIAMTMAKYSDDVKANTRSKKVIGIMSTDNGDTTMELYPIDEFVLANAHIFRSKKLDKNNISLNAKIKVCEDLTPINKFHNGKPFVLGTDAAVYDEEEKTYRTLDDEIRNLMIGVNFDDDDDDLDVDALLAQL
jgi:hypothetical protein